MVQKGEKCVANCKVSMYALAKECGSKTITMNLKDFTMKISVDQSHGVYIYILIAFCKD